MLIRVSRAGAGAVVSKSFNRKGREGYRNPSFIEVHGGFLNALGIPNPGMEEMREEVETGQRPKVVAEVTQTVKSRVHVPVFVKLSPNVTDITEVARAAEGAGADAVTAINTVLGTAVDVDSGLPILGGVLGGLSGPAIHPVALRAVYQIRQAVRIPVIGVGGIEDWKGAVQMMMAGASAVQIGSAITIKGLDVFREVTTGMGKFLERKGYSSVREIVSMASTRRVEG